MKNNDSSVCIIMSAYNAEDYIVEQVNSILSQKNIAVKLWIRDDGSKDRTALVLKEKFGSDSRVVITSGNNLGAAKSFIEALFECDFECDYYGFSDADDVWTENKLSLSVEVVSKYSVNKPVAVSTRLKVVDASLREIGLTAPPKIGFQLRNSLVQTVTSGASIVMNKSAYNLLREYRPSRLVMHDAWAYLVITAFGEFVYLETPTILYRQHGQNVFGASHGFVKRTVNRLNRLVRSSPYLDQAKEFFSFFGDRLSKKNKFIVEKYVCYNDALFNRLIFAISPTVQMQTRKANLFMRVLILFGRA